ncbi:MAG TPA: methylase, partial [Candidatus Anaerobiospirillum stercoravium]|nr:methylase [Candidatus Anaerobiospirillum stercoravium]
FIVDQAGASFDWSAISPTIFGAVFESTLNPETRRLGGMHYTSVENIHKVIDPLFLDELKEEFAACMQIKTLKSRTAKLLEFQHKLSQLTFLDPACGSGNFLTEAYLSLRRLENQVIRELNANQAFLGIEDLNPVKVSLDQFAGIEINDFAVSVAKTALWIAQSQMLDDTSTIINHQIDFFPLTNYDSIVEDNALTLPWENVVPLERLNYVMGNPPFSGARTMSKENKQALKRELGSKWPGKVGDLDFVCGWFKKAHDLMVKAPHIKTAFVATNSICQGTSITNLWAPLIQGGSEIIFAYRSFIWDNEASDKAHVYCVIVGFANKNCPKPGDKHIYDGAITHTASNINGYLLDAPDVFIYDRSAPLCSVPVGLSGCQRLDDNNYIFTQQEKDAFIQQEPQAEPFFKRWYGSMELIQGKVRYCLYLGQCSVAELAQMPEVRKRVEAVRQYRLTSSSAKPNTGANEFHYEPQLQSDFLVIPRVSSSNRDYIPIVFLHPDDGLCSDQVKLFPDATLYHFSVLSSSVHMAWVKMVAGRLKMDYRYSTDLVYNNFPWPQVVDAKLHSKMEAAAQAILDARAHEQGATLAELYDQTLMPSALRQAHEANDRLVMQAYGFDLNWSSEQIFAALYQLYQQISAA